MGIYMSYGQSLVPRRLDKGGSSVLQFHVEIVIVAYCVVEVKKEKWVWGSTKRGLPFLKAWQRCRDPFVL